MYELTGNGFTTITLDKIRKYIRKAQNEVIYAKPAFYTDEMEILLEAAKRGVTCNIYFDKGDTAIRRRVGEADYAEFLVLVRKNNIEFGGLEYFDYEGNLLDKAEIRKREYHKQVCKNE